MFGGVGQGYALRRSVKALSRVRPPRVEMPNHGVRRAGAQHGANTIDGGTFSGDEQAVRGGKDIGFGDSATHGVPPLNKSTVCADGRAGPNRRVYLRPRRMIWTDPTTPRLRL